MTAGAARRSLALAGALALAACAGHIPRPTDAQVSSAQTRWPDVTRESLEHGRELYVSHCSSCHPLHEPGEMPADRWPSEVAKMSERAKLSPAAAEQVTRYLMAVSP